MIIVPFRVTGTGNRTRLTAFFDHLYSVNDMPTRISDQALWGRTVSRLSEEWRQLAETERQWIVMHARRLGDLQNELHQLFLEADGAETCRLCAGDCCGHGRFHPTLANLLLCLVDEQPIPKPDFAKSCPYGGTNGCLFPPAYRPFNCISFVCERIEARLAPEKKEAFYCLEDEIRTHYEAFSERYTGGSLRGILLRGEELPAYLSRW